AERPDRVLDVAEATGLCSVAVDLERPARERGGHEPRDDHPVLPALPGPDRVEEPDDDAVESPLLVVGEREELVERLRFRIGPAAGGRRPVHPATLFGERFGLATVAVDLRRRRDEHTLAEPVAMLEH